MAYLKPLNVKCCECTSRATQALYSWQNEPLRDYCSKHAVRALKERQRLEESWTVPQRP